MRSTAMAGLGFLLLLVAAALVAGALYLHWIATLLTFAFLAAFIAGWWLIIDCRGEESEW